MTATQEIRQALQLKNSRSKRSKFDYSFVNGLSDLLSYKAQQSAYGIAWALQTGRLPGMVDIAIRKMTAWQYTALIGEVVDAGIIQNDVPRFLISKLNEA